MASRKDAPNKVDALTKLLTDIRDRMDSSEVETMKNIVLGNERVGKAAIEKCKDALTLFRKLEELLLIEGANLSYLVDVLKTMKRFDLVKKVEDYNTANTGILKYNLRREQHITTTKINYGNSRASMILILLNIMSLYITLVTSYLIGLI